MKHCSLCKYTSIKFFKHRGNSVIKPHISNSLDIFYIEHIRKLMFLKHATIRLIKLPDNKQCWALHKFIKAWQMQLEVQTMQAPVFIYKVNI